MLGCDAAHQGKPFDLKYLFAGFSNSLAKLVTLSVSMGVATMLIFIIVLGSQYFDLLAQGDQIDPAKLDIDVNDFLLRILIALALILPLTMAAWFAPALIVLHNMPVIEAVKASVMACTKNIFPFLIYGLVMLALYLVAIIPFMLGLLFVVPVIFTSIYSSYRDIFLSNTESSHMQLDA